MSTLDHSEFEALIAAAKLGDRQALSRLVENYEPELRMIARKRLGRELRPFLDSVDLVQSVHRSLLVGFRDRRFEILTPESLLSLASTIVQRKIARSWRRLQRQKRGELGANRSVADLLLSLQSTEPSSLEETQLKEGIEILLKELDTTEQSLVELRLQGYSTAEVANFLEMDADVLRVKLSRLRKRLRERGILNEWL